MSRYVIEIKPEYEDKIRGVMILGAENSNVYLDSMAVDELKELNSDYINEHFSDLQNTAYQRGLEDGKKAFDLLDAGRDSEYQRGLDDAWEAARKIGHNSQTGLKEVGFEFAQNSTYYNPSWYVVMHYAVSEVIEKLKAYEEKKESEIRIGDVLKTPSSGKEFIAVSFETTFDGKQMVCGFTTNDGKWIAVNCEDAVRTNKHHDCIESIMKEKES